MIIGSTMEMVFSFLLLIVMSWALIFGSVGALLGKSRNGSPALGACWGVLLGPLGLAMVLWTTRDRVDPLTAEQFFEEQGV